MAKRKKRGTAGDKTICLEIAEDIDYTALGMVQKWPYSGNTRTTN